MFTDLISDGGMDPRNAPPGDDEVDDDDFDDTCLSCDGTGEGLYDGAACRVCRGCGVYRAVQ